MQMSQDTHDRIDMIASQLAHNTGRLEKIEEALAQNTELTQGLHDLFVTFRTTTKLVKWVGGVLAPLAALGTAWTYLKDHLR
jgi:hypothetical protein